MIESRRCRDCNHYSCTEHGDWVRSGATHGWRCSCCIAFRGTRQRDRHSPCHVCGDYNPDHPSWHCPEIGRGPRHILPEDRVDWSAGGTSNVPPFRALVNPPRLRAWEPRDASTQTTDSLAEIVLLNTGIDIRRGCSECGKLEGHFPVCSQHEEMCSPCADDVTELDATEIVSSPAPTASTASMPSPSLDRSSSPPHGACDRCGEPAAVPYRWCSICKASPSWHHGRCCPERPQNQTRQGFSVPVSRLAEGLFSDSESSMYRPPYASDGNVRK